jgi:hypothetical protein
VDDRSFGNSNERTWNTQWLSLFGESAHDESRVGVAIGMPLTLPRLEANRQHSVGQRSGRRPIIVDDDSLNARAAREMRLAPGRDGAREQHCARAYGPDSHFDASLDSRAAGLAAALDTARRVRQQ